MSLSSCGACPRESFRRMPQIPFPSSKAVLSSHSTQSRQAVPLPIRQTTTEAF